MTRLAVFDCDGTLVDGQDAICSSMEEAFAAAGLTAPHRNKIRRVVGLSLPFALSELAPEAGEQERVAIVEGYKHAFSNRRSSGKLEEPLFEGMADLLARLSAEGWLLGVATGKSDRGLFHCLETHGIRHHFVTLQTADRHPSKPHPAMLEEALSEAGVGASEAVMIGDTSFDIDMARNAGVAAVGVAWGYHEPRELLAAGAQGVAETMTQLEELIRAAR